MTDASELREKVARAMAIKDSGPEGSVLFDIHWREFGNGYLASADAALAVALEEAAKVAQKHLFGDSAAAAIRALIPSGSGS